MQYKIGEKVFGDWVIVREIGQGAFGTVYEIHKMDTNYGISAKSALKVIRIPRNRSDVNAILSEGMDEQSVTAYFQGFVDEIIKEISIMSSLKGHSNIVSYEDHCVIRLDEGIGWEILIRMELLSSLQDYVRDHVMEEREVIRLGMDICSALVHCQKKGMIHRDIKPENIFVNESGQFKLGDFGIARTLEKTTGGLSKKGTEGYMAPEVYKGRHYGANVDVYSLGLVLYKFMNGNRLPFLPSAPQPIKFTDRERALEKRMSGEALPFPEYASTGFAGIILKACSFQKDMRYHTAEEMLEDLKTLYYLSDDPGDPGDGTTILVDPLPPEPPKKVPIVLVVVGFLLIIIALITVVIMVPKNIYKHVNVENGVGTGDYVVGSTVTVTADEPDDGYEFVEWTIENGVVELSDPKEMTVDFEMPKQEVSLLPVYQKKKFTLTIEEGKGSGTYASGERVEIQAGEPESGYFFSGWNVVSGNVELLSVSSKTSSFIMPEEDVLIKAVFEKKQESYDVTVNDGLGSRTCEQGTVLTITAYPPDILKGYEFVRWRVDKGTVTIDDVNAATTTLIVPEEDVVITAEYRELETSVELETTPEIAVGDTICMGTYEQDDNTSNGLEDIEWTVLARDTDKILLISKYGIECGKYNEKGEEVSWADCTLRSWLNTTFINSTFTNEEQKKILETQLENADNPVYGTKGGERTKDRIFLLSADEAESYFASDDLRKVYATDSVKSKGVTIDENYGTSWWWLRTPGSDKTTAACVYYDGEIHYDGRSVDNVTGGRIVRPALWMRI